MSDAFSLAEKLAMNVAAFVATTGGPESGGVAVGVGVGFVTVTVPVIPKAQCGIQKYGNDPALLKVCEKVAPW